jgi:hypothetical protein
MHFHANHVSTSVFGDGDYYQITFEAEEDTDGLDSPYLLIQRDFEDPDDQQCYIETHCEKYCGHFRLRRVDFTPQKLSIELDRPSHNFVSVTFAMAATEFKEASQMIKIISGEIEPPDARAVKSYVGIPSLASVPAHGERVR